MLADAREEFRSAAETYESRPTTHGSWKRSRTPPRFGASMRFVICISSLKLWLAPHVLFTSMMLVLMIDPHRSGRLF